MKKIAALLILVGWILVGCESEERLVTVEDTGVNQEQEDADEPDVDEPDADEPDADEPDADEGPVSCEANDECDEAGGEYCARPPGCEDAGECRPLQELLDGGCGDMVTTYCACDGETRVSPDTCVPEPYLELGACEGEEDPLEPGQCLTNADCPGPDRYCDRPPGCTLRGECAEIPSDIMCAAVITDYCDCDGESQQSPSSCIWDAYDYRAPCVSGI